ncbi:5-oxoprolinase subunit PxpB [Campylobacter sputorum]|uniref:5-oxoprolinase subunit PxpB n=1 Tax=Campylobacter sputorum TaxID=206 RepID=UPI00068D91E2|nr:5-oxoprolinase subunit PxpB [Campylobacter sputorum]
MSSIKFFPIAGVGVMIKFGDIIDFKINFLIRNVAQKISKIHGVIEIIPSYNDLCIHYDPSKILYEEICMIVDNLVNKCKDLKDNQNVNLVEIPVCYCEEFALDKESVISHTKLDWDEIVKIHTSKNYLVYMMGFMPGFCYLGGMDERINTPRLKVPREQIPKGSVGLAGSQTGIYPWASPGGWKIIGKTPIKMYDIDRKIPSVVEAGDYIKFKTINLDEFKYILNQVENSNYEIIKRQI